MPLDSAGATLVSGMKVKAKNQDVLANNLANVNTTGFKRDELSFATALDGAALAQNTKALGIPKSLHEEVYYGHLQIDVPVRVDSQYTHQDEGAIVFTDNPMDAAILGDGYFSVQTPQGERFTKAGAFALNQDGYLVTPEGHGVLGLTGPIRVDGREVKVLDSGEVEVDGQVVDILKVVRAENGQNFEKEGNSRYRFSGSSEDLLVVDQPTLQARYLERANVNPIVELNTMTLNMRAYEAETRAFRDIGRTLERAISSVGKA